MKRFDDYEKSFHRISKEEALASIEAARQRNDMFVDADVNKEITIEFSYWN